MYAIAWIVLLAGFGYCAGGRGARGARCDARVAAGVSTNISLLKEST